MKFIGITLLLSSLTVCGQPFDLGGSPSVREAAEELIELDQTSGGAGVYRMVVSSECGPADEFYGHTTKINAQIDPIDPGPLDELGVWNVELKGDVREEWAAVMDELGHPHLAPDPDAIEVFHCG